MIEVAPRLFVGNALDYEKQVKGKPGWAVVHCAKEPYHREAVGYTGRGCDNKHAEYLMARRDNRLCLNMIDAPTAEFFRDEMIDAALAFITEQMNKNQTVLVHCNQGGSRAPSLALLYLRRNSERFEALGFDDAEEVFRAIYPLYVPANGIREYVQAHW